MSREADRDTRFLSALSQELRTPVGSILMLSELITSGDGRGAVERARTIHGLALDLRELIDEVGELARLDQGRARLIIENVPTAVLAADVERTLTAKAPSGRPLLATSADDLPATVRIDRERVAQIVTALAAGLNQAEGRSIRLQVEGADDGAVAVRLLDTVADTGPDDVEELFRPFGTPSRRTSRTHGGQSLRMAIARRMARAMAGDLTARASEEGLELTLRVLAAAPAGDRDPGSHGRPARRAPSAGARPS